MELDEGPLRRLCQSTRLDASRVGNDLKRVSFVTVTGLRVLEDEGGPEVPHSKGGPDGESAYEVEADQDYVLVRNPSPSPNP